MVRAWTFYTTTVGTLAPSERVRFDAGGHVRINTVNPGTNVVLNAAPAIDPSSGFPYIPGDGRRPNRDTRQRPRPRSDRLRTVNKKLWVFDGRWRGSRRRNPRLSRPQACAAPPF